MKICIPTLEINEWINSSILEKDYYNKILISAIALGDFDKLHELTKNDDKKKYYEHYLNNILSSFNSGEPTLEKINSNFYQDFDNPYMYYIKAILLMKNENIEEAFSNFQNAENLRFPLINQLYLFAYKCIILRPNIKEKETAYYTKINNFSLSSNDKLLIYNSKRSSIINIITENYLQPYATPDITRDNIMSNFEVRKKYASRSSIPEIPYKYYKDLLNIKKQLLNNYQKNIIIYIIDFYLSDIKYIALLYQGYNLFDKNEYFNPTPGESIYKLKIITNLILYAIISQDKVLISRVINNDIPMYFNRYLPDGNTTEEIEFYDKYILGFIMIDDFESAARVVGYLKEKKYNEFIALITILPNKIYPAYILSYKKKLHTHIKNAQSFIKIANNHESLFFTKKK